LSGPAATPRPGLASRIEARVEPLVAAGLGVPRIAMAHRVWYRYGASSGPLLARGLAFTALFTLVPALLLIASIATLAVSDPETRVRIVAFLVAQFPPLADVLGGALDAALAHAGAFSLIGAAVLVWSASGLVRDLDGAFDIIFRETGKVRTVLRTVLRTVVEVLVVALAVVGLGLIIVLATVPGPLAELIGLARLRLTAVLPLVAAFALAFRFLPRSRPGWHDAIVPAAWVGLGASVLTGVFSLAGPVLFGSADLYGAFAGIFLGLIWLSYVIQLLLIGATWVAVRADDRSARAGSPRSMTD
jgi:membrane protein